MKDYRLFNCCDNPTNPICHKVIYLSNCLINAIALDDNAIYFLKGKSSNMPNCDNLTNLSKRGVFVELSRLLNRIRVILQVCRLVALPGLISMRYEIRGNGSCILLQSQYLVTK
jgi:hypothetical protein